MQKHSPAHPKLRIILIAISVLLVLLLISIGSILILRVMYPRPSTSQHTDTAQSADSIVTSFSAASSIPEFSTDAYQLSKDTGTHVYIFSKDTSHEYGVNVTAKSSVIYYAKTVAQVDHGQLIIDQTTSFLKAKGFTLSQQPVPKGEEGTSRTAYTSSTLVCQLSIILPNTTSVASYTFACQDQAAIAQEYTTIEQLLNLYKKTNTISPYSEALRVVTTDGNKIASFVTLTHADASRSQLLFITVDTTTHYIANLSEGDGGSSNGKYVPSKALTAAFQDPTYGTFLQTLFK